MVPSRFEGIDSIAMIVLNGIEDKLSYNFRMPMLLLEALQFPGSVVRWDDSKDNTGLRLLGHAVICLAAAAGEYELGGLRDPRGNFHPG